MAAGARFGMLLTLPAWAFSDLGTAFFAGLGSFASFLAAGRASIRRAPLYPGAAAPEISTRMDIKTAFDETVLGYFITSARVPSRSEEHTSELQSLMRISSAVFCLNKNTTTYL